MRPTVVAGALVVAALSRPAEAVNWPVRMDLHYCWNTTSPCTAVHGVADSWLFSPNDTGEERNSSYLFHWRRAPAGFELRFDALPNTTYVGHRVGGGCFEGTMSNSTGMRGTWAGCR